MALVLRRPTPGQQSVERVFSAIVRELPSDLDVRIVVVPHVSRGLWRRMANLLFVARLRDDVVHVAGDIYYCILGVARSRSVLTVLDMVSLHRLRGLRRSVLRLFWYSLPLRRAGVVTVISEAVGLELEQEFASVDFSWTAIGCPIGPEFLELDRGRPQKSASDPRVLIVGAAPHKNVERVACALVGAGVELRIIGRLSTEVIRTLDALGIPYSSASGLADDEIVAEYRTADVLVFASLYEGFGLPILEAQALGTPVVTSDRLPMTSVAGSAAVAVDPLDLGAIRRAVDEVLADDALREGLVRAGYDNVRRFSADALAAEYASVYRGMVPRQ